MVLTHGNKEAVLQITEICGKLEGLLSAQQGVEGKIAVCVDALCRIYNVQPDEVAIFSFDQAAETFSFAWPKGMRISGSIPLSANRSLVAITARERRCMVNNTFSSTPHLFVFEGFGSDKTPPIQRIMSVPMLKGEELRGVIQVSRKGEDTNTGLKSFSEPELAALGEIAKVVARHL